MNIFKPINLENYSYICSSLNSIVNNVGTNIEDGVHSHIGQTNIHHVLTNIVPLVTGISKINLLKYWIYSVIIVASKEFPIHKDEGLNNTILLPVLNTEGSITTFYKPMRDPVLKFQDNGIPYFYYDQDQVEIVDSLEVSGPTLMNVAVPHSVSVGPKVPRITISLRFSSDADHIMEDLYG